MQTPTTPPEMPRPDDKTTDAEPSHPTPPGRHPDRGGPPVLGTLIFVLAVIGTIFTIGIGGLGFLLMLVFEFGWPLAAPGILLYVIAICLPAGLAIWAGHRGGRESRPLRLLGPLPIAAGAAAAIALGQIAQFGRMSLLVLICFWLAAALPPLAAFALASGRLGAVTTWRRGIFGLVIGSLVSTTLTLMLGGL